MRVKSLSYGVRKNLKDLRMHKEDSKIVEINPYLQS